MSEWTLDIQNTERKFPIPRRDLNSGHLVYKRVCYSLNKGDPVPIIDILNNIDDTRGHTCDDHSSHSDGFGFESRPGFEPTSIASKNWTIKIIPYTELWWNRAERKNLLYYEIIKMICWVRFSHCKYFRFFALLSHIIMWVALSTNFTLLLISRVYPPGREGSTPVLANTWTTPPCRQNQ